MKKMIVAILVILSGCYTQKKAEKQQDQILRQYPNVAMEAIRKVAPCVTTKADTTINSIDTTIYIDCPDNSTAQYFTIRDTTHDTAFFNNIIIRKIPITLPVKTITVIKTVKDSSEVIELNNQIKKSDHDSIVVAVKLSWWHQFGWWIFLLIGMAIIPAIKLIASLVVPKIPVKV